MTLGERIALSVLTIFVSVWCAALVVVWPFIEW
jgi:hypothetical protein